MFKKTLISLAVASSVGLTGCFDSGETGANANPDYQIEDTTIDKSVVRPVFDPNPLSPTLAVPAHFDLLLLLGATQSANHDFTALPTGAEPVRSALNELNGFSTSSAFNIAFDGELNPETVLAGQTVFMLALDTAPAVPTAPGALPAVNPADITGIADPANQPTFSVDVVSMDGGTNNAIRITPLEPLEEKRKYLVLVGNGVTGANGKPIERSVQAAALADGVLGNPALENVQNLLVALNNLGNTVLQQAGQTAALSYTFTTNGDADVLRAMASPLPYLESLGQKIGFTAQLKAVRDEFPDLNFSELTEKLAELGAAAADPNLDPSTLTAAELRALVNLQEALAIQSEIPAAIEAQVGTTLHVPQPRPFVKLSDDPATDIATITSLAPEQGTPVNEWNPIYAAATQVTVSQGAITVPYYQHLPGESGSGITSGYWTGNTDLEDSLNNILAGEGETVFEFLRDIDTSLNVNGYFPFPQLQGLTTVPITVIRPNVGENQPASCDNGGSFVPAKGVTIFQHGITVDRSTALLPGILLAQQACQAVVAIDQPLHGLAGDGSPVLGTVPGLDPLDETAVTQLTTIAETTRDNLEAALAAAANGQGPLAGDPDAQQYAGLQVQLMNQLLSSDYFGERHFGFTDGGGVTAVAADLDDIESGSLFVNPLNMLNSRDNLRQGTVDLLNLAATVNLMPIINGQPAFQGLPVNFVGHSLGGISGSVFASLANDPAVQFILDENENPVPSPAAEFLPELASVTLHDTGGQVTRLLENSQSRSGDLLDGLAGAGVVQKTSDFESFFYIFQSLVDAGDPVSFSEDLGRFQSNLLVTEVIGDRTVPNEAATNPLGQAFPAPLAGTEPMIGLIGEGSATGVNIITPASEVSATSLPAASFFVSDNPCTQANHGTFVGPITPADPDNLLCPGGSNTSVAFQEMVRQTIRTIGGNSVLSGNPDTSVLGTSDTINNFVGD